MPDTLVTDTHAFLLYLAGDRKGLGAKALRAYDHADRGEGAILVPVPTLLEVLIAAERGLVRLEDGPRAWTARLRAHPGFAVVELTAEVVQRAAELSWLPAGTDRLIAATALRHRAILITRRAEFGRAGLATLW
jgi:PIN domain nuclease of toxin-antitoxin system